MDRVNVTHDDFARLCSALGHSVRLQALVFLVNQPHGGAYVSDLVEHLSKAQSTVSHHLKILVDAGLLVMESHGNWGWYQMVPTKLAELRDYLSLFGLSDPTLKFGSAL